MVFPPPLEIIDLHTKCPAWKKCTLSIILNLILHDFFKLSGMRSSKGTCIIAIIEGPQLSGWCNGWWHPKISIFLMFPKEHLSPSWWFFWQNPNNWFFSSRILVIKEFFPNVIPSIARNPIIEDPRYYNIRQLDDACLIMRVQVFWVRHNLTGIVLPIACQAFRSTH